MHWRKQSLHEYTPHQQATKKTYRKFAVSDHLFSPSELLQERESGEIFAKAAEHLDDFAMCFAFHFFNFALSRFELFSLESFSAASVTKLD